MARRRSLQVVLGGALTTALMVGVTVASAVSDNLHLFVNGAEVHTRTLDPGSHTIRLVVDELLDQTFQVEVPEPYDGTIQGDFAGTVPAGQHWHVTGDVNLTGDLIVEGLLTGVDTFTLTGNGFQILVQNGGVLDLAGVEKSGWVEWGVPVVGWTAGDRLAVAPTAWQKTLLLPLTSWAGDWAGMTRPVDAPDVTIIDGSIQRPEVANLDRSITFRNLTRIHFHDGVGVQSLKYLAVVDSGVLNVLDQYPIHFHLNGESSRGSLLEGVVVENGKNHAMVPHGSHGITMRDLVAYNTTGDVYWWNPPDPNDKEDPLDPNNSNDLLFDRNLSLGNDHPDNPPRLTAFFIGGGTNNQWVGNVAVGVQGGKNSSGYRWTEHFIAGFDGGNEAHNNRRNGIFAWTNSNEDHLIDGFVSYHNRRSGVEHGAYNNTFTYRNMVIHVGVPIPTGSDLTAAVIQHALSKGDGLLFENIITDDRLLVLEHSQPAGIPTIHRNADYTHVTYTEGSKQPSEDWYLDCDLVPGDFNMAGARPGSIAEIYEGGVLTHRWAAGAWS